MPWLPQAKCVVQVDAANNREWTAVERPGHVGASGIEITEIDAIGAGMYARVFKGVCKGTAAALKISRNEKRFVRATNCEIFILKTLGGAAHHIIPLIADTVIFNGLEMVPVIAFPLFNRTLWSMVDGVQLPEAKVRKLLMHVASALRHLKLKEILHRDVKPENIMWHDVRAVFALGDFNCAANCDSVTKGMYIQSRYYRAPENLLCLHSSSTFDYTKPDQWSFGALLAEMVMMGSGLFKAKDSFGVLHRIRQVIGSMPGELLRDTPWRVRRQLHPIQPHPTPPRQPTLSTVAECAAAAYSEATRTPLLAVIAGTIRWLPVDRLDADEVHAVLELAQVDKSLEEQEEEEEDAAAAAGRRVFAVDQGAH